MPNWTKEQEEAIYKKGKNIIVSAGAGSGKTAVLTERVTNHLKNGVSVDNLLILTFTNAAAAEMKERIRKQIKKIPELKKELDKIDTAYITTFDAFSLALVKKYSHILNISKDIKIAENSFIELKKEELLREIFDNYYIENNREFLKLIDDFNIKDDRETFNNILSLEKKIQNIYDKRNFLENFIETYYSKEKIENNIKEYIKYIEEKIEEIKEIINKLSLYIDGEYIEKVNESLLPLFNSKTYDEIKTNLNTKLPRLPKGTEEEVKNIKKEISEILKEIENLTRYESEQSIKKSIEKTKVYSNIITKILLKLETKISEFKNQNNLYEFIDISNKAIDLLKTNKEVRNELKEKFYEILIDEYQDTNDLQETFVSLIEKNNVYMVGDIKQSIYRFRNTNPKLFKDKYNLYTEGKEGLKIDLNKNFRSREEVLSSINKMFDYLMNEDIGGAEYRISHRMIYGNKTYEKVNQENYKLEILDYDDDENYTKEEIEIFTIASDIKEKIKKGYEVMDKDTGKGRKLTYSDCAILLDRSTSFEKYRQIFEYLNIPLSVYKDKTITDSKDILLIKNIYELIIDIYEKNYREKFKYSYISISRSYLFETDDNIIFDSLNNIKETKIYEICQKISKTLDETTNYKLIEEIINKFSFYEKIIKDGNINEHLIILDSIKKIAQNMDDLGYNPFSFLKYLKEIIEKGLDIKIKINKEGNDAVKIMTIHASKGLEYPLCYYSGLYKKFNIDDLKQKFYFEKKYGIISPYIDKYPKTTILKKLLRRDYLNEEISEKLRLFYVALTRAREKIIIVTSLNQKPFNNPRVIEDTIRLKYLSFKDIIDSLDYVIDDYIKKVDLENINLTKKYKMKKRNIETNIFCGKEKKQINELNINAKEIEDKHFSKTTHKLLTKEESNNIKLGLKMHETFENFDFKNPDYTILNELEKRKIKSFIDTNILENYKEIYQEYEFIYEDDAEYHGIIDLLIIKEEENIIVDYKLKDISDKAYIKQLEGYKNYIQNINGKNTKIYLYSILDEKLKEILI